MDWIVIALRLVHIGFGALWMGAMVTLAFFLPAVDEDAAHDPGRATALFGRGFANMITVAGVGAVASGFGLTQTVWGGMEGFMSTHVGMALAAGGIASIFALVASLVVLRPALRRSARVVASMASTADDAERRLRAAELRRLRVRSILAGRLAAGLLVFAVGAMAVARYL